MSKIARLEHELHVAIKLVGGTECATNPDLFDDDNAWLDYQTRKLQVKTALKICFDCPVQMLCREYAITANEPTGIWGGMTTAERATMVR